MKIVVCGPPHSGKSVFLTGLVGQLARSEYYLFRACPDGEGSWTYAHEGNSGLRRKGKFNKDFVEWCARALHENHMAPIVLVDVGGVASEENKRIMAECDKAIIISSETAVIPVWRQFCVECGLEIVAELHSNYKDSSDTVSEESDKMVRGSVHYLERGEDVTKRPAIEAVGRLINKLLEKQQEDSKMTTMRMMTINSLAQQLGKEKIKKVLPNGKEITTIEWTGEDLRSLSRLLHNDSAQYAGQCVDIDGGAPGFLVAALVHELHPCDCRVNSPDGFIPIRCESPSGDGKGDNLEFKVEDRGDYLLVTCQQVDPAKPLDPTKLGEVAPPEVPMGSIVVLNGRMPHWLLSSLGMSYHGRTKAVAAHQPGAGATVFMTHSASVELGSIIKVVL